MSSISDYDGEIDHISSCFVAVSSVISTELLYQDPETFLKCVNKHFIRKYCMRNLKEECIKTGLWHSRK